MEVETLRASPCVGVSRACLFGMLEAALTISVARLPAVDAGELQQDWEKEKASMISQLFESTYYMAFSLLNCLNIISKVLDYGTRTCSSNYHFD